MTVYLLVFMFSAPGDYLTRYINIIIIVIFSLVLPK